LTGEASGTPTPEVPLDRRDSRMKSPVNGSHRANEAGSDERAESCRAEFGVVVLLAAVALIWWGGCTAAKEESHQTDLRRAAAVNADLTKILAKAAYRAPGRGLQPDQVWSGQGAEILHSRHRRMQRPESTFVPAGPVSHSWEILARSASGRYFFVIFSLREPEEECNEKAIATCVEQGFLQFIGDDEIKAYVYQEYKDPNLYRKLFHEEMPPLEIRSQ
jgi:hypothetical protein